MDNVSDAVQGTLEPYVGVAVANMCVRAAAAAAGKTAETLAVDDLPSVVQTIRNLLAPIAPAHTIEVVCEDVLRTGA